MGHPLKRMKSIGSWEPRRALPASFLGINIHHMAAVANRLANALRSLTALNERD